MSDRKSKVSENMHRKVVLIFSMCLHSRDEEVIKILVAYFKSLNVQISANTKSSNHIYKTEKTVTL